MWSSKPLSSYRPTAYSSSFIDVQSNCANVPQYNVLVQENVRLSLENQRLKNELAQQAVKISLLEIQIQLVQKNAPVPLPALPKLTYPANDPHYNYKGKLFEYAASIGTAAPTYSTLGMSGSPHMPIHSIMCRFDGRETRSCAATKSEAHQYASLQMLNLITGQDQIGMLGSGNSKGDGPTKDRNVTRFFRRKQMAIHVDDEAVRLWTFDTDKWTCYSGLEGSYSYKRARVMIQSLLNSVDKLRNRGKYQVHLYGLPSQPASHILKWLEEATSAMPRVTIIPHYTGPSVPIRFTPSERVGGPPSVFMLMMCIALCLAPSVTAQPREELWGEATDNLDCSADPYNCIESTKQGCLVGTCQIANAGQVITGVWTKLGPDWGVCCRYVKCNSVVSTWNTTLFVTHYNSPPINGIGNCPVTIFPGQPQCWCNSTFSPPGPVPPPAPPPLIAGPAAHYNILSTSPLAVALNFTDNSTVYYPLLGLVPGDEYCSGSYGLTIQTTTLTGYYCVVLYISDYYTPPLNLSSYYPYCIMGTSPFYVPIAVHDSTSIMMSQYNCLEIGNFPNPTVFVAVAAYSYIGLATIEIAGIIDVSFAQSVLDVRIDDMDVGLFPLWTTEIDPNIPPQNGYSEYKQRTNNKTTHSLNGNSNWREDLLGMGIREEDLDNVPDYLKTPNLSVEKRTVVDDLLGVETFKTALGCALRVTLHGEVYEDQNYFSALRFEQIDLEDVSARPDPDPQTTTHVGRPAGSKPFGRGKGHRGGEDESEDGYTSQHNKSKKGKDKSKPPKPPHEEKPPMEKRIQREQMMSRIIQKFRTEGDDSFVAWVHRTKASTRFQYEVATALWGKNWDCRASWQRWWVSWQLSKFQDTYLELAGLISFSSRLQSISNTEAFSLWYKDTFSTTWHNTMAVFASEADAHNSEMHSYNGNPRFAKGMKDIQEAPKIASTYESSGVTRPVDPWVTQMEISTVEASTNPQNQDIPITMPLRGDVVTVGNQSLLGLQLNTPESLLVPRTVRNGAGAVLINSNRRLRPLIFGLMNYTGASLVDSDLLKNIIAAALTANQNLGRAENVTLGGFQAFDVAYFGRLKSFYGLSMESALFKLACLHSVVAWAQNQRLLPLSGEVGSYDPYTQFDPANTAGPIVLGYNDSPVFGEDCGGATAQLPYRGGTPGSVSFHLAMTTVPEAAKPTAILVPASLIVADQDNGLVYALILTMFADWPTLMWTLLIPTLDTALANALLQTFMPHIAHVFVPGQTDIHLLLPRQTAVRNPRAQNDANSYAILRPMTGSVVSTAFPNPNTLLNINFEGGALITYNLAEFMYTWGQDFNQANISNFMQRLGDVVPIIKELDIVQEKLAYASVRYPPLVCQAIAGVNKLPANSGPGFTMITCLGTNTDGTVVNWPQTQAGRPDFLLHQTDILSWNKMVCAMANVDANLGEKGTIMPYWVGNPLCLYWSELTARMYATVANIHFADLGFNTVTWDSAYGVNPMYGFRRIVRAHYIGATSGDLVPKPAALAKTQENMFGHIIQRKPVADISGNSIYAYLCPAKATYNYVVQYNAANIAGSVPVFLPDVWIHQTARNIPQPFMSYPPQNNADSTVGLREKEFTQLRTPGYYGPELRPSTQHHNVSMDSTRDDTDYERWNTRLMHSMSMALGLGVVQRTLSDVVIPNSVPAGSAIKSAIITADYTMPNLTTGVRSASTLWMPLTDENGILQFPTDVRANVAPIARVIVGQTRAAIEIWSVNGVIGTDDMPNGARGEGSSKWYALESAGAPAGAKNSTTTPPPAAASGMPT